MRRLVLAFRVRFAALLGLGSCLWRSPLANRFSPHRHTVFPSGFCGFRLCDFLLLARTICEHRKPVDRAHGAWLLCRRSGPLGGPRGLCGFLPSCSEDRGFAVLALAAYSPVLTDAAPSTVLALAAYSPMLTDAAPPTVLALAAYSPMLTNAAPPTVLARVAFSPMLTDAAPSTLLAPAASTTMLAGGVRRLASAEGFEVANSSMPPGAWELGVFICVLSSVRNDIYLE